MASPEQVIANKVAGGKPLHMADVVALFGDRSLPHPEPMTCPFCGSDPVVGRVNLTTRFSVHCDDDYCSVAPQATASTVDDATALWNRRVK